MSLIRWDPLQDSSDLFQQFNRLLGRPMAGAQDPATAEWRPVANITENDSEYLIKAELPEVKKEDIHLDVRDGVLSIRGERKFEQKHEDDKVHRVESFYGAFSRSFRLPEDVEAGTIEAEVRDGILHVHLPKTTPSEPRSIDIKVK